MLTADLAVRICNDMSVALALVDKDNKIQWTNQFFCRMVEYPEGELTTFKITDLCYEQFSPKFENMQKQLQDGTLNSYSMVGAFKKNGDTTQWRRIVYGSQTIQRHPIKGDIEYYVVIFIPFDGVSESWMPNLESLLTLLTKHYKLILFLISTVIALMTGSLQLTSGTAGLDQRLKQLEELLQSYQDSGLPPSSASDVSPTPP